MKQKQTEKVMDVWNLGAHFTCVKHLDGSDTPYWLYKHWWDGGRHKKLIRKARYLGEILQLLADAYTKVEPTYIAKKGA